MRRKILSKFVDFSHYGIMCFWCSLFFVPVTWWPDKISFHFFLTLTMFGHQFVWGGLVKLRTGKFHPICILTTISQRLQGLAVSNPENYNRSFTREILRRIGLPIPQRVITVFGFFVASFVVARYFFLH